MSNQSLSTPTPSPVGSRKTRLSDRKKGQRAASSSMDSRDDQYNGNKDVLSIQRDADEDSDSDSEDEDYVPENEEQLSEEEDEEISQAGRSQEVILEQPTEEEEKKRGDELWSEFLKDVEIQKTKIPANRAATSTVTKTKVYDFAGESVKITQVLSTSNNNNVSNGNHSAPSLSSSVEEGTASPTSSVGSSSTSSSSTVNSYINTSDAPTGATELPRKRRGGISFLSGDPAKIGLAGPNGKKGGGIQAVLNALQAKKQKMGTLEKSRLDWQSFKKVEGIEEELQTQVKSKNGYLERQEFLQRADLRQFELEKNMRAKRRRNP